MAGMAPVMVQKFPVRPKTGSEPAVDITKTEPAVSEKIREYVACEVRERGPAWHRVAGPGS